jgi:hypothetical protein
MMKLLIIRLLSSVTTLLILTPLTIVLFNSPNVTNGHPPILHISITITYTIILCIIYEVMDKYFTKTLN